MYYGLILELHKTTGFSPYQLLFGKQMRMPLDQMVSYWQGKEENDESSVSEYIATLKANMQVVWDLVYDKERDEKVKQKFYHDQKAKERTFIVGDFVFVFRPGKTNKRQLMARTFSHCENNHRSNLPSRFGNPIKTVSYLPCQLHEVVASS